MRGQDDESDNEPNASGNFGRRTESNPDQGAEEKS
jgi:hypothetical protein